MFVQLSEKYLFILTGGLESLELRVCLKRVSEHLTTKKKVSVLGDFIHGTKYLFHLLK